MEEDTSWLREDVKNWEIEGVINENQSQKILSKYGLEKTSKESMKVSYFRTLSLICSKTR